MLLAGACQRIEFARRLFSLAFDPAFLFQLVERGVERPVADLKNIAGYLKQPLPDRPAVQWLEGENLENQQIQSPLEEIGRLAHSCSYLGYRVRLPPPRSVVKARCETKKDPWRWSRLRCLGRDPEAALVRAAPVGLERAVVTSMVHEFVNRVFDGASRPLLLYPSRSLLGTASLGVDISLTLCKISACQMSGCLRFRRRSR